MKASMFVRAVVLGGVAMGCGSPAQPAEAPGVPGEVTRRDTAIVHEACETDGPGAVTRDANRDGRPDLISVSVAGKKTCEWLDFNFDGIVDAWVYFAPDGQVRRRETDFDRDGRIDEIAMFEGGKLTSRQRAATLAGRIDTWQYFNEGVLQRAERDADGDGVVDQWWEYPHPQQPECPIVHADADGDGRPDPGATVELCPEQDSVAAEPDDSTQDEDAAQAGPAAPEQMPDPVEEEGEPASPSTTTPAPAAPAPAAPSSAAPPSAAPASAPAASPSTGSAPATPKE